MRHLALLLLFAVPASGAPGRPIIRFADEMLNRQAPDGAIVMGPFVPAGNGIVPYFSNVAAMGLLAAHRDTGDKRYLAAAKRWADWHARHMNATGTVFDYTGHPGHWVSKNDYDSTDSYAATYLELLNGIAQRDKAWAKARYSSVGKAVKAIRLTLQPNRLTLAKPKWPVMYTMDNVETARGLRAAVALARAAGRKAEMADYSAMAGRMEAAIESRLWDSDKQAYYVGIQADGGIMKGAGEWYPDTLANIMAVASGVRSKRHADLYKRLVAERSAMIPSSAATEDDVDRIVWWALAARTQGDARRFQAFRANIAGIDLKALPISNTALLGQACTLLAGSPGK